MLRTKLVIRSQNHFLMNIATFKITIQNKLVIFNKLKKQDIHHRSAMDIKNRFNLYRMKDLNHPMSILIFFHNLNNFYCVFQTFRIFGCGAWDTLLE